MHVKALPTKYEANKKAWLTSDIFKEWVKKVDLIFLILI